MQNKVKRKVRVMLTDDELSQRRNEFAIEQIRINDLEQEKKDTAADYKRRIDELMTAQDSREEVIKTRTEDRVIDCVSNANFATGMMEYYDASTMNLVDERSLTPEERQLSLLGDENVTTMSVVSANNGFLDDKSGIKAAAT